MQRKDAKHIIYIPVLLMLAFLLFPLLHQQKEKHTNKVSSTKDTLTTGFEEYDLLPPELKEIMRSLQQQHASNRYHFSYFFEIEDINYHYYLIDAQHKVIRKMPVTNPKALAIVEEEMMADQGKGYAISYDQKAFFQKPEEKQNLYQGHIAYILPADKEQADFQKLRVSIIEEKYPPWVAGYYNAFSDTAREEHTYHLAEVDEAPSPIRGMEYFRDALTEEIKKHASFLYEDLEGDVWVTFTIGQQAKSPQIIQGFSTKQENHAYYRVDGAIIKAINDSKVHWKAGKRKGKYVDVRLAMLLSFKKNKEVLLSISDLQDVGETW